MDRSYGETNYYITQMLTGHGSFEHFLYKIGKRETAGCFHCPAYDDTVDHTLGECPAWSSYRNDFINKINVNRLDRLSLALIIGKILERKEYWLYFSSFAVSILKLKEEEERRRCERISPLNPNQDPL